jgi:hypothetical protein
MFDDVQGRTVADFVDRAWKDDRPHG